MNKMWLTFFQPQYKTWRLWVAILFGVYYFLFFYFFKPFKVEYGLANSANTNRSYVVFAFIVFFALYFCSVFLPKHFSKHFLPANFTFKRFSLLVAFGLLMTATLNYLNLYYFFNIDGQFFSFIYVLFNLAMPTILVTTIPLIFFALLIFNYVTERINFEESTLTQSESTSLERTPQYNDVLTPLSYHFTDNTNKRSFYIPSDQLYYIVSAQNYIEVFYKKEDKLARLVLRNSLKALEEDFNLDINSSLIRCHKAFIVNREKVIEINGPSKAAYFVLEDIEETIPISRHKYLDLKSQFSFLMIIN
jgi:LytTr DNA-binding domain